MDLKNPEGAITFPVTHKGQLFYNKALKRWVLHGMKHNMDFLALKVPIKGDLFKGKIIKEIYPQDGVWHIQFIQD
tara:strand:- start:1241 stop:1465 length:225 start_codon:yes stop_codon:yes gene_type:complete